MVLRLLGVGSCFGVGGDVYSWMLGVCVQARNRLGDELRGVQMPNIFGAIWPSQGSDRDLWRQTESLHTPREKVDGFGSSAFCFRLSVTKPRGQRLYHVDYMYY